MSRKRKKTSVVEDTSAGIPEEEILAEGSGGVPAPAPLEAAPADHEAPIVVVEDAADIEAIAAEAEVLEAGAEADPDAATEEIEGEDGEGEGEGDDVGAAAMPTSASTMDPLQFKQLVEALIFASDKPITIQRIRQLTRVSDMPRLQATLAEIQADYEHRGLVLQQVSGGYQFRTRPQFSGWVQQLIAGRPVRLSRAQLETLAIVAYRQPITRPEIDDIRGVDSSATLKLLMDRALIRMLGKKEEVGRPILYGTTKEFLDFFSLGDLRELPTLREYSELSDESRRVMTDKLGPSNDDGSGGGDPGDSGGAPPSDGGSSDDGGAGEAFDASSLGEAASELLADSEAASASASESESESESESDSMTAAGSNDVSIDVESQGGNSIHTAHHGDDSIDAASHSNDESIGADSIDGASDDDSMTAPGSSDDSIDAASQGTDSIDVASSDDSIDASASDDNAPSDAMLAEGSSSNLSAYVDPADAPAEVLAEGSLASFAATPDEVPLAGEPALDAVVAGNTAGDEPRTEPAPE